MEANEIRDLVRQQYAGVADLKGDAGPAAQRVGYCEKDLSGPAADGNLGLGCGNPSAIAALAPGEVVIDLGSGAGFDALLAAERIGPHGRFIGVDMTPEMLARARENAVKAGYAGSVEFREGIIERLPVVSETADVVISNCVINLSPDKPAAIREAFRVLKPGGRLAVSDIVLSEPLPDDVAQSVEARAACVAGAATEAEYRAYLADAGFVDVQIAHRPAACLFDPSSLDPLMQAAVDALGPARMMEIASTVFSSTITARKP